MKDRLSWNDKGEGNYKCVGSSIDGSLQLIWFYNLRIIRKTEEGLNYFSLRGRKDRVFTTKCILLKEKLG